MSGSSMNSSSDNSDTTSANLTSQIHLLRHFNDQDGFTQFWANGISIIMLHQSYLPLSLVANELQFNVGWYKLCASIYENVNLIARHNLNM